MLPECGGVLSARHRLRPPAYCRRRRTAARQPRVPPTARGGRVAREPDTAPREPTREPIAKTPTQPLNLATPIFIFPSIAMAALPYLGGPPAPPLVPAQPARWWVQPELTLVSLLLRNVPGNPSKNTKPAFLDCVDAGYGVRVCVCAVCICLCVCILCGTDKSKPESGGRRAPVLLVRHQAARRRGNRSWAASLRTRRANSRQ